MTPPDIDCMCKVKLIGICVYPSEGVMVHGPLSMHGSMYAKVKPDLVCAMSFYMKQLGIIP